MILFCDECTGPLVDAPDGDYRDPYGGVPGILKGLIDAKALMLQAFSPEPDIGLL